MKEVILGEPITVVDLRPTPFLQVDWFVWCMSGSALSPMYIIYICYVNVLIVFENIHQVLWKLGSSQPTPPTARSMFSTEE